MQNNDHASQQYKKAAELPKRDWDSESMRQGAVLSAHLKEADTAKLGGNMSYSVLLKVNE